MGTLALCVALVALRGSAADLPTASGLAAYAKAQIGNAYILGAYGQTSTVNFRYGRAKLYPEAAELIFRWGDAWDGLPAFDCIGLLKAYAQISGATVSIQEVNAADAWQTWLSEWGPLQGAALQPGMAVFRVEGPRMRVVHVGIYVGGGMVVHARGTRWGVILEPLPNVFTHWGRLNWLSYDTAPDPSPTVTGVFLDVGSRAVVDSDDAKPVTVSPIPHESGKLRSSIGHFADGAIWKCPTRSRASWRASEAEARPSKAMSAPRSCGKPFRKADPERGGRNMENASVLNALLTRRSTRAYQQRAVERPLLEKIVEAGRHAPSASNRQLWHFTVVTDPQKLDQLARAAHAALREGGRELADDYYCTYHAPTLIIVTFPRDYAFAKEDGACALQTLFLAAHALGLGSCWINQLGATCNHPSVRKALSELGVPADHDVCGCAAIGYIAKETPLRPRAENSYHFVP